MTDFITDTQGITTTTTPFHPEVIVSEFMEAFETSDSVDLWLNLVDEERTELLEAMAIDVTDNTVQSLANTLKEAADYLYVLSGLGLVLRKNLLNFTPAFAKDADMLLSEVIDVVGTLNFEEAFKRVHESNMSKLGDDGKPVRREDGKVLKGPNYKPPVLNDLVIEAYSRTTNNPNYLINPNASVN